MLSYELCKKLKGADFPQLWTPFELYYEREGTFSSYHWLPHRINGSEGGKRSAIVGRCYIPTLSELIKACGDKFIALEYLQRKGLKPGWSIVGKDIRNENVFNGGATPEEAVANLWLAINCSSEAEKADIAITNLWLALNKKKV